MIALTDQFRFTGTLSVACTRCGQQTEWELKGSDADEIEACLEDEGFNDEGLCPACVEAEEEPCNCHDDDA